MHTSLTIDDPNLATAMQRLDDAQRTLDAALVLHAALPDLPKGTASVDLDRLEDARRLTRAREGVAQAQHLVDVAAGMARTRFLAARTPARVQRLRALLAATEAAQAAARALHDFDHETAATLGLAPRLPPLPLLLTLDDALVRLQREIRGDAPPEPAPPPLPGYVRVQVRSRFMDLAGGWHYPDFAGQPLGPEDLPAKDAEVALREGWVAVAEA